MDKEDGKKRKTSNTGKHQNGGDERSSGILGKLQPESEVSRDYSISVGSQNFNRRATDQHEPRSPGEVVEALIRSNQQQILYLEAQNATLSELLSDIKTEEN